MKRYIIYLSLITLFVMLSGCSSKPCLELINSSVDVVNEKGKIGSIIITEGDKKGQELVPTALYYEFTIKNAGHKDIGSLEKDKGLHIKIAPNTRLETISNEIVGFNVFNPSAYVNSGVGYGDSFTPILKAGTEGKYVLYYELGVNEKGPQAALLVPPAEKLKELKDEAFDATLILMSGDNEIARFDLNSTSTDL